MNLSWRHLMIWPDGQVDEWIAEEKTHDATWMRIQLKIYGDHSDVAFLRTVARQDLVRTKLVATDSATAKFQAAEWAARQTREEIRIDGQPALGIGEAMRSPKYSDELRPMHIHPRTREVMKEIGMLEFPEAEDGIAISEETEVAYTAGDLVHPGDPVVFMLKVGEGAQEYQIPLSVNMSTLQQAMSYLWAAHDAEQERVLAEIKRRQDALHQQQAQVTAQLEHLSDSKQLEYQRGQSDMWTAITEGLRGIGVIYPNLAAETQSDERAEDEDYD